VKITRGSIKEIPFKDLIAALSAAGFSGRLTLNEGEHFCIIEFFKGNVTGSFGWKLEGDNAIIHLLLEKKDFTFSLPDEADIEINGINVNALPRGSKHIIDLIETFEKDFNFLKEKLGKSVVINENTDCDVDLTGREMLEVMKFTEPVPLESFMNEQLKENLYGLKKFFDKKLLTIKD